MQCSKKSEKVGSMVKLRLRRTKKRYIGKDGKDHSYQYERIELPIPKKFHETIGEFFEQELNAKITVENDVIFIDITPNETSEHK
jgi:hypothetical protein